MGEEITIRFFGKIAEKIGHAETSISTTEIGEMTIRSFLASRYPGIENYAFTIAVNQELSEEFTEDTREISIFPPFAGG
jgi:molybdopterin converting factor small subunit